ncbi:hypothetical protein [Sphaerisporangium album]|uniref:hypothetical protein n=1 Tax=Sphaerisporangium album TaxID=509200 RepID=UPI001C68F59B|nr:hypothetical protein [Sphaerisporangium album]
MREHAATAPDFAGAFLSGSSVWLPEDAELPAASDVDIMVVTTAPRPPAKLGKFTRDGVLLEVTYLTWDDVPSAEAVLVNYHLAGCFRTDTVLADPTGRLTDLHLRCAARYAERPWVLRRCAAARARIVEGLGVLRATDPSHDQVTAWLFPTGVTTHVLLTAGLRNPTVRLRYLAARTLLEQYGHAGFHEELLALLGCADMTRRRAEEHLRTMTAAFDAAARVAATPFFFSSDISPAARPIAVDGGRALIDRGDHREAVFWIAATYARCLKILACDAPEARAAFVPGFAELRADLGVASAGDLERRANDVHAFLPRLWDVAEAIIDANPEVRAAAGIR